MANGRAHKVLFGMRIHVCVGVCVCVCVCVSVCDYVLRDKVGQIQVKEWSYNSKGQSHLFHHFGLLFFEIYHRRWITFKLSISLLYYFVRIFIEAHGIHVN